MLDGHVRVVVGRQRCRIEYRLRRPVDVDDGIAWPIRKPQLASQVLLHIPGERDPSRHLEIAVFGIGPLGRNRDGRTIL